MLFPPRQPSFRQRALVNHLLFASMGIVVMAWSILQSKSGPGSRFSQTDFEVLAKFIDAKQVAIPSIGALLLYLIAAVLSHQSGAMRTEERAFHFKELLHGELSSLLLSSASLAFTVGWLFIWSGNFSEGFTTLAWWPAGLSLSYFLRPKSQDGIGF